MIRAGRKNLVRTLTDLAKQEGRALGTYKNNKMHKRTGHPKPISSPKARVLLYDGEQIDAFRAGEPIPQLPDVENPDDLLDQHEAAELVGVAAKSWETYRQSEELAKHLVLVAEHPDDGFDGVEHWPRRAILDWDAARPGRGATGGRKPASRDAVPRGQATSLTAQLLDAQPDITARQVVDRLGIHYDRAYRALSALRAACVGQLLVDEPHLTAQQVVDRLGYQARSARTALLTARAHQRSTAHATYVRSVLDSAKAADIPVGETTGIVVRPGGICAAAASLSGKALPASLVWDERYGWRTDPGSAPSLGQETEPPTGKSIRYFGHGITPPAADVLAMLRDRRTGSKHPPVVHGVQA
ncbi:hypothetical protein ACIBBE_42765 [Streptomyces sp. NPDC051644]|uniref:hypothetical protein n=1 Tax=Streptomyces sp. NPDC051644 TaxID=3365666 RepID=UPI0037BCF03E